MRRFILLAIILILSGGVKAQYCNPSYEYYASAADPFGDMCTYQMDGFAGYYLNDTAPRTGYGAGYADRTHAVGDTVLLQQGNTYSGTITYGDSAGYTGSQVWIDFNDDLVFSPSEAVSPVAPGVWIPLTSAIFSNTVSVTIPATAATGYHRMRVRNVWYDFDHGYVGGGGPCVCAIATALDPCLDSDAVNLYWSGVTADYTVNIAPGCTFRVAPANSSPICMGGDINLYGNFSTGLASTYSWAGPDGFTSTLQNPVITGATSAQSGVYTFTATSGVCSQSDTTTVYFFTPTASIRVPASVCSGNAGTVIFTGTPGGTVSYQINGGSIMSITIPASGTVSTGTGILTTGSTAGTVTYTLTRVTTFTCSTILTDTASITINPKPSAITGISPICQGLTINVADADTGGTWSVLNNAVATVSGSGTSAVVSGVASGGTSLVYTFTGTGCKTSSPISVDPGPGAISGLSGLCEGTTTSFSDTSASGTWSVSSGSAATIDASGVLTGVSAGTVFITYTIPTGCYVTTTVTVNATPPAITGATNLCLGATTLLGNAMTGGSWSSADVSVATVTTPGGVVTGVSADTARIIYTSASGCTTSTVVTVKAPPSAISGASTVCTGVTTTFTDGAGAGTWSSSNSSLATIDPTSGSATAVGAGTAVISFTLSSDGCSAITFLTINTIPYPITGATGICAGGSTTTLSDTLSGGTWTSSNTSVATIDAFSGVVTGVGVGSTTITYSRAGCAITTVVTASVQPGAIISPVGDTALCPGDMVMLTANTGRSYTYQWYAGTTAIAGATDEYFEADSGASYSVEVRGALGCVSNSVPMLVSVTPAVATITHASPLSFCPGSYSELLANTGSGLSYQWLLDGGGIAGATGAIYNAGAAGDYSVVVSTPGGCSATSGALTTVYLPAPASTISYSGSSSICNLDSLLLDANTGTGLTYQWLKDGINIYGATGASYSASVGGNYQVLETNTIGCANASSSVAVNVLPLPNSSVTAAGPLVFCAGGNVRLVNAPVAGNSYQWYDNGLVISGATNNSFTAATSGHYVVKVIAPTGCYSVTTPQVNVDEVTTPVVIAYTSPRFCWGGSAVLGVDVIAATGIAYQWQLAGSSIPGATNSIFYAYTSGDYSCVINLASGCTVATAVLTTTELPLPDPIITYDGLTLKTQSYFTSYQWIRNLVPVTGGNSSTFVPSETGEYTVRVIDTNGCQSVSSVYVVRTVGDSRSLGTSQVNVHEISVYPNPVGNVLNIVTDEPLTAVIQTVDGRTVSETASAHTIDMSRLEQGFYILKLYNKDGILVKIEKLVKE